MDHNTIADNLDRMAVQHQTMVEAAAAFRKLGSIDQATKEAENARAIADQAATDAARDLVNAKQDVATAKTQAAAVLEAARKEAVQILADANSDADGIVSLADDKAGKLMAEAKEQAKAKSQAAESALNPLLANLTALKSEVAALTEKRDLLNADADEAQAKLDVVREAIAKLKAS